ncbi:hypothetical protein SB717_33875, partial [Priestia sp. SIMBA_032]|uniref:hypothetical protein n=1 Tax=Priestia sp. SIMBA_032 TaxID=3085775 RepID=UPI00397E2919
MTATYGDHVFASVQLTAASAWQTVCFDSSSSTLCQGSWPLTTSPASFKAGNTFAPLLSTTGRLTGVCTITYGGGSSSGCWSLGGVAVPENPYAGTGADYNTGSIGTGDVFVSGTKVYPSRGDEVMCRDFG